MAFLLRALEFGRTSPAVAASFLCPDIDRALHVDLALLLDHTVRTDVVADLAVAAEHEVPGDLVADVVDLVAAVPVDADPFAAAFFFLDHGGSGAAVRPMGHLTGLSSISPGPMDHLGDNGQARVEARGSC